MKILHLSTTDNGGAGRAALRLHQGLSSIGVESAMLALYRESSENNVVKFEEGILRRVWKTARDKWVSLEFNTYRNTRPAGVDLFTDDRAKYDVGRHNLVKEADIINLHWIGGMVDYLEFFGHMTDKPIVWTLHDMNPFTGGCHYSMGCTRYETGCGSCPQLGSNDENDLSGEIFKRKQKAYKDYSIHIVTPSTWLADCAKKSLLFKNFKIDVIPHGVSTDVFTKRDKHRSRDLLNLPQDKLLILFGADYETERKGLRYLIQALKILKDKKGDPDIALVLFGRYTVKLVQGLTIPFYRLGYIDNEERLSCVYSAADIFMLPSLEDNLPSTVLESMAHGTPVIGFNTGGIPDMVTPQQTGLLAQVKNSEELAEKIEWMIDRPRERQDMGEKARKLAEQRYTLRLQAERYFELYKAKLNKNGKEK